MDALSCVGEETVSYCLLFLCKFPISNVKQPTWKKEENNLVSIGQSHWKGNMCPVLISVDRPSQITSQKILLHEFIKPRSSCLILVQVQTLENPNSKH